ncbi:MAG: primosomal protein [Proteobacteria bacterium]|nr:primosomal protein [Pseudomonadota bacterium]NDD04802.1 primosomal protein [Pseudomonadota bacterium]
MKLICEVNESVNFLVEEKEGKKHFFIEGIFMQADIPNRNGRMYNSGILEREVDRYNKEYIKENRAFGELGHPQGPSINLDRVSHMIKSLVKEGSNFIGKAKIMDTPYGNIVKNLMSEGASLGVSSRGMGSLKPNRNGINEVQDDFHLATAADIVADPSAPDAFVRGIMEGVEWVWDNGILKAQRIEEMKKEIEKTSSRNLEEQKINIFKSFINSL